VPFVVNDGTGPRVRAAGFTNLTELQPWQSAQLGPVRVTAAPGVPEVTYLLEADGKTVFFGGDTMRIPQLDEIGRPGTMRKHAPGLNQQAVHGHRYLAFPCLPV
jgi:L-ascorbate metabolism protein UlaG (beta-lactamase superfamily)